ncbi:hypothetical protein M231_01887 [Tremella mesenterica]|uniref:Uncharacterized protein n=1 Tax=Tremella mesenterica TaxID=5217 RepID=A0A4Q1BSB3_TREME|nr:hypothetical protein M231_01887 [Tremella mesenterica]
MPGFVMPDLSFLDDALIPSVPMGSLGHSDLMGHRYRPPVQPDITDSHPVGQIPIGGVISHNGVRSRSDDLGRGVMKRSSMVDIGNRAGVGAGSGAGIGIGMTMGDIKSLTMGSAKAMLKRLSTVPTPPPKNRHEISGKEGRGGSKERMRKKHSRTASDTTADIITEKVRAPVQAAHVDRGYQGFRPGDVGESGGDKTGRSVRANKEDRIKGVTEGQRPKRGERFVGREKIDEGLRGERTHKMEEGGKVRDLEKKKASATAQLKSLNVPPPRKPLNQISPLDQSHRKISPPLPAQQLSNSSISREPSSIPSGAIQLRPDNSTVALLRSLISLIPPSRTPSLPSAETGIFLPASLLTPLSLVLEVLVVEREVLKDNVEAAPRLPILADGRLLQLRGEGEVDWRVAQQYFLAVGQILLKLLKLLDTSTQGNRHTKDIAEKEELIKSVRMYVGKMKKVFSEVAAMYVEGYGFVRGWWDEGGMKGAAGEIGRWGEILNV